MSDMTPTQITSCQTRAVSTTHVAALAITRRWPTSFTVNGALLFHPKYYQGLPGCNMIRVEP